jgi:hypothetical protein
LAGRHTTGSAHGRRGDSIVADLSAATFGLGISRSYSR